MTLNCMFRFAELYKTGIAIAFVSSQKLYDTALGGLSITPSAKKLQKKINK